MAKQIVPTSDEDLERRIIAALEAAGGEATKTAIRQALHCRINTARFDQCLDRLVTANRIERHQRRGAWVNRSIEFRPTHSYAVTVFTLRKEPE